MTLTYFKKAVIFILVTVLSWHYLSFCFLDSCKIQNASVAVLLNEQDHAQDISTSAINSNGMIALAEDNSNQYNWNEIDRRLSQNLKTARLNAEELAKFELNSWKRELMRKADKEFLNWYFSFLNQKGTEYGAPFAWLAFKLDQKVNVLSNEDEKDLNAGEIIKKRLIKRFNNKFNQLVFDNGAKESLKESIKRIGISYATSIGTQFSIIKAEYQVSDPEWKKHLGQLADLIYNTGNTRSNLSATGLNSDLATKVFAATTAIMGTKLATKLATNKLVTTKLVTKATGKIAGKTGVKLATGLELLNPIVDIGLIVWEVWDYQNMVDKSRPELRQNISDYLEELKYSILSGEDGILSGISEVEADLYRELKDVSSNYF